MVAVFSKIIKYLPSSNIMHHFIFSQLIFIFLSCSTDTKIKENKIILLPNTEIRLEFRGIIQKSPQNLIKPPFRLLARSYSCPDMLSMDSPKIAIKEIPECMTSYVEKVQEFTSYEYKIDLDVPANWTHAYIEILNLESTRGMYSPGFNPNWFGYSKGEIITFRNDFIFRTQENPIPDKKQMDLANRFSPILILHESKKEIPTNLEKYSGLQKQLSYTAGTTNNGSPLTKYEKLTLPFLILPSPSEIPNYDLQKDPTNIYFHVRYANTFVSGTQDESLPGFRDNENYWYELGDGKFVVSYWLWFDNNQGPSPMGNEHQGDLESYSVLCDAKGNPLRILITGHDHITLDTEWKNINSFNHHPILFVASGRKSDGGNPLSAYGSHEVFLNAGNSILNLLADPRDAFPDPSNPIKVILPSTLKKNDIMNIKIGKNLEEGKVIDLSKKVFRSINSLVPWEEPGWINKPSVDDPDGNHNVDSNIEAFLKFNGRIGKHPQKKIDYLRFKQIGESPRNVPFKINIEQHYTYEKPRMDRTHSEREGNYGPKFIGTNSTPQFSQDFLLKNK